jgi:3',5'-cyclic AMP phosphodiesterase CpdA
MRVLHLSDIHYGLQGAKSKHRFLTKTLPDPKRLLKILSKDGALKNAPEVIIVSGDVGWSGTSADYGYALPFLQGLQEAWPSADLVVVPGNHDVDNTKKGDARQEAFVDMLRHLYKGGFDARYPLYAAEQTRPHLVSITQHSELLVVGVNTAAYLDAGDGIKTFAETPIFISNAILDAIEERIESSHHDTSLRIFVMHHHLLSFAEPHWGDTIDPDSPPAAPDSTIVANSGLLQKWLADHSFSIVLHGHKHLAHGRSDSLWTTVGSQNQTRSILIVGAGSAGVASDQLAQGQRNTFNVLDAVKLAKTRWAITVDVRRIDTTTLKTDSEFTYDQQLGEPPRTKPVIFTAERMEDCHRAIEARTRGGNAILNFLSIVESSVYVHPPTACIGDRTATPAEVEECFRALHPEYNSAHGWDDQQLVKQALQETPKRFRFQHGPRLFGIPGRQAALQPEIGPIQRAVENVAKHPTRAYVGLFNPDLDVISRGQPPPALMGIQFLPDGTRLDVVVFFRNLELSFWWVVNMYEIGKLLEWAARYRSNRYKPGSITFTSPIASWSPEPGPTFVARLDEEPLASLTELLLSAADGDAKACSGLKSLIEQKRDRTNEGNLDTTGLDRVLGISGGLMRRSKECHHMVSSLNDCMKVAVQSINEGLRNPDLARASAEAARTALDQALKLL